MKRRNFIASSISSVLATLLWPFRENAANCPKCGKPVLKCRKAYETKRKAWELKYYK